MGKLLNALGITIFFILILFSSAFSQEQITVTAYYPSPYGSYKELRADQIAIGSAYRDPVANPLANGNLIVSGNVGIGTASPGQKLGVVGNIKMSNGRSTIFTQGDNNTTHVGGFQFLTYDNGVDNVWTPTDQNGSTVNSSIRLGGFGTFNSNTVNLLVSGNVGIGTPAPGYRLDVNGDLRITGTPFRNGGDIAWQVPSDARLKDIVTSYEYGLREINKINLVRFNYKEGNPLNLDTHKQYVGIVAQEVQKVIPEAVSKGPEGYLSLNSTPIIWAMLNAIKEQQREIEELRIEIKNLNQRK